MDSLSINIIVVTFGFSKKYWIHKEDNMRVIEKKFTHMTAYASAGAILMGSLGTAAAQTAPDRTTLPIHGSEYPHSNVLDVRIPT